MAESLTGGLSAPLDPAIAEIGQRWKTAGIPDLYAGCLEPQGAPVCRERANNVRALLYPKPVLPAGKIEQIEIDGKTFGAAGNIRARIIWPHVAKMALARENSPHNTLVYFHGGGWVVGDLDSHEAHAIRLANEAQCVVLNVDYRLAPEHQFPAAYHDALAATKWALQNIARLGGNAKLLALGGDSAGGNLAAAVAVACRNQGIALAAQLLLYPATNLGVLKGPPEIAYLGEDAEHRSQDWRASPFYAASHEGLAPAIIGVGPHDFLYKDNVAYAEKLRLAKVPLVYREYPDMNHGFFSYTAISKNAENAALQLCHDLRAQFEKSN